MPAATLASISRALVGRFSAVSEPASTAVNPFVPVSRRDPRIPAPSAVSCPPLGVSAFRKPPFAARRSPLPRSFVLISAAPLAASTPHRWHRAEPPCGSPSLAKHCMAD
ncbi:hypothetical protein FOMPIDRAFT_1047146 [Fomitopsis schrenkii]|uniref:Uncharacterized protein n=1 Tax=Fomitopsis schrenkii TaxID=2126942 RepID=S8EF62_FOMSC|nr:hypothetical protein FOMPIDRAFT_1047146 [Fomitopsis schrenkii]